MGKLIDSDAMVERNNHSFYDTTDLKEMLEYEPPAFDINMVLDQLEDYGKYKGVLHIEEDGCENYIPVSVAKQIVKGRGLGGVLGYMKSDECE